LTEALAPAGARRGRPSTGARERIAEAGLEVLKADGYAGLTIAKVAAAAGENKALISYHFGSRQGLIAAVGREVGEAITAEVVAEVGDPGSVHDVVSGVVAGVWAILERDARIARVYFDLTAVSVVETDVRRVMREIRTGWRETLVDLLRRAGVTTGQARAGELLIRAAVEGLALERIEAGDSAELRRARRLMERVVADAIAP
jgi:TetR/AcrR family transcriptional regulator, transcriptional repressor of bet genes